MVIRRRALLGLIFIAAVSAANLPAQQSNSSGKKPITPAVMKQWNSVRQFSFTNDGKWYAYLTGLADSNLTLHLGQTGSNAAETLINVGGSGGSITFSDDSRYLAYQVSPAKTTSGRGGANGGRGGTEAAPGGRGGRGGRGGTQAGLLNNGDLGSLSPQQNNSAQATQGWKMVLRDLSNGTEKEFSGIRRYAFVTPTPTWLIMQGAGAQGSTGGSAISGTSILGARGSGGGADLLLYNIGSGEFTNMSRVDQYAFTRDGNWMAYVVQSPDLLGNAVRMLNMKTGISHNLDNEPVTYSQLNWIDSSRVLRVYRTRIDSVAKDTLVTWADFRNFTPAGTATMTIYDPSQATGLPDGYELVRSRAPTRISDDSRTALLTVRLKPDSSKKTGPTTPSSLGRGAPGAGGPGTPPPSQGGGRGTAQAGTPPAAADSSVTLILWHFKDPRLQSAQIVSPDQSSSPNRTFQALWRGDARKLVLLSDSSLPGVTVSRDEKFAYGIDSRPYELSNSYTGRNWQDVYKVDLQTGQRTLLQKKRWPGTMSNSPDGQYQLFWARDGNYWKLDLATGDSVNITKGIPTYFGNREEDHNNLWTPAAGVKGWSNDGKWVLLYDMWDIWKVPTTPGAGKAVNLTVNGRKDQIRYQSILRWNYPAGASIADGYDLSLPMYISTYGEWTKKEGVSLVPAGGTGAKPILFEDAKFSIQKVRDADRYFFTRQTFTEYPDWWTAGPDFKDPKQLTNANPQIKDLAWSSGTRLINFTTAKGDKLQAAMYLPADFDPNKKYPMLVTIYEKRSQGKNSFVVPSETRAPDPSLYTSRGYIVLDPDIVYKINDPGMSAVWALIPAVKAAVATGFVDAKKVGLWGHSWGGYQTAFMVTQTDIFAAAIAGAPLTNMISMYASIYWNSGGTNAAIFEASQGRFKGNFLENEAAYIRNSPVFFADKMNTPLMILHNDKDGAVDFNQGVTYYNTLVQLNKPVIMLEYVGENHGLAQKQNQIDYATRMGEFFDHYLKDAPAPDWLENGIPRAKMAEHLKERAAEAKKAANGSNNPKAAADSTKGN